MTKARAGMTGEANMPEYVVTRWYRAPELLLSCARHDSAIDMWAVGCILAEMLGRKPLFPGRDFIHTLNLVCKVVGTPSDEDINMLQSDGARMYMSTMPHRQRASFSHIFQSTDPLALDLLDKLLMFRPDQRLTAAEALQHPYLAPFHDPNDEPIFMSPLPPEPEIDTMPINQVRAEVAKEIFYYNPDLQSVMT